MAVFDTDGYIKNYIRRYLYDPVEYPAHLIKRKQLIENAFSVEHFSLQRYILAHMCVHGGRAAL